MSKLAQRSLAATHPPSPLATLETFVFLTHTSGRRDWAASDCKEESEQPMWPMGAIAAQIQSIGTPIFSVAAQDDEC